MLTEEQIRRLRDAKDGNDFPRVAYDFVREIELPPFENYRALEAFIRGQLTSAEIVAANDGLSNVLHWGWATSGGLQKVRRDNFRNGATPEQLAAFATVVQQGPETLGNVAACDLPEFSHVSYISKVLMFLDPGRFVTLDRQLAKIKHAAVPTIFANLHERENYLPVSARNEEFYRLWCKTCADIAQTYFAQEGWLAVDVERAFFVLVRNGETEFAA